MSGAVASPPATVPAPVPAIPRIGVARTLDAMFFLLREKFWVVYGIAAVVQVPFFFYNLMMRELQVAMMDGASPLFMRTELIAVLGLGLVAFMVAWIAIWPIGVMAATSALVKGYVGEDASVGAAFKDVIRLFGPAIGLMLAVGMLVGFGSLMCLAPGIYLMIRFYVAFPVLVVERCGVTNAMKRSGDLVAGNYWRILLVILSANIVKVALIYAITFTGTAAFTGGGILDVSLYALTQYVGQLFVAPIDMVLAVVVYFELREAREGPGFEIATQGTAA